MTVNVNLGSGPKYVEGWISYDKSLNIFLSRYKNFKRVLFSLGILNEMQFQDWDPKIKYADIRSLKFPEESVDNFYLSHVLEHVYFDEAQEILDNCYKSLKFGGILRVCSPDYDSFISKYINEKIEDRLLAADNFNNSILSYPRQRPTFLRKLLASRSGHVHFWQPFESQMIRALAESGFSNIQIETFQSGLISNLKAIEFRNDNSFYIEAVK